MEHTYGNCQCGDWHSAKEFMAHFMDVCDGGYVTFHGPLCDNDGCVSCCAHVDKGQTGVCLGCGEEEKVG